MAAEAKTVTAPGTISPKVFWPLLVGVALTFLASFLAAVTPDMLEALGPFAVPTAISLGVVAQTITAYLKRDELRDIGVESTAAIIAVQPTSQVAPVFEPVDVPAEGVMDSEPDAADNDAAAQLTAEVDAVRRTGSTAGGLA